MSASGESPPNEDPGVEQVAAGGSKDASDAETEPAMLEEEEMPTYISLTGSSRLEESRLEQEAPRAEQNEKNGNERASSPSEHGAESVCVLSSGEESDRQPFEMVGDYDSDEIEDMDEEEEEEEDEDDSCMNDEDEDCEESDGDIEPEQFERSSDDFVLRYDSGLEKHHKERSRSLQDLTIARGNLSRFVGKRRNIAMANVYETEFARKNFQSLDEALAERKKVSRSVKYDHVPSKVKLYIQEMKEQNRRSAERRSLGNAQNQGSSEEDPLAMEISRTRVNAAPRTLRSYVQTALDEINTSGGSEENEGPRLDENLAPKRNSTAIIDEKTFSSSQIKAENVPTMGEKILANGLVDYSTQNHQDMPKIEDPMEICEANGQEETAGILNLRTLSYEEFTNGVETSSAPKGEIVTDQVNGPLDLANTPQTIYPSDANTKIPKIDISPIPQIVPASVQHVTAPWSLGLSPSRDNEVDYHREENRKKTNIETVDRDLHEKVLQENKSQFAEIERMKKLLEKYRTEITNLNQELNDTKETLDRYQTENQKPPCKSLGSQTEPSQVVNAQTTTEKCENEAKLNVPNNKHLLSSSVTSGLSSIEQWTDSNCSPCISIDPPNIENALNSDDSLAQTEPTPGKNSRPLSQSFVTSSRILQTLASITQGKNSVPQFRPSAQGSRKHSQTDDVEKKGQSKRYTMLNEHFSPRSENNYARAKKRKASDMLGQPSCNPSPSQQFKMPQLSGNDARRKINSDSDADGAFKKTANVASGSGPKVSDDRDNLGDSIANDLEDTGIASEVPENIKCFVYHDEPDSKERSFLIQASESPKNENNGNKGGNVRECGPYLLGNVEIRMSETNGTINIWGKEVEQSMEDPDVQMEDSEVFEDSSFARPVNAAHNCPSTPKHLNGNTFVCSTSKKMKTSPQFSRYGIAKYFRMSNSRITGNDNQHYASSPVLNVTRNACEHCETYDKRVKWPSCEHLSSSRIEQPSCCVHDPDLTTRVCINCSSNITDKYDGSTMYETMSNILGNHNKCTAANREETACRSRVSSNRRHSSCFEDICQQTTKRCSSCAADPGPCSTRLATESNPRRDNRSRSHTHISCDDEDHPLISNGPENCEQTKRRRLSGKKVRGIFTDLLRGCSGGCRNLNATSNSMPRASLDTTIPVPNIRVTECTPRAQPSGSKRTSTSCPHMHNDNYSNDGNERCCRPRNRRADMKAQIESQLETFRVDMDRLRSRSDELLQMLNLLNAETD